MAAAWGARAIFLLGPRSTGKSHLIRQQLTDRAVVIDLLRSDILLRLASHPEDLEAMIDAGPAGRWIVLDEIQRVPWLLPEVHPPGSPVTARWTGRNGTRAGLPSPGGQAKMAAWCPLVR